MNKMGRRLAVAALFAAGIASAQAISFSNITVTGSAFGGFTNFGSNGLTFDLADNFLVGAGVKTVTIKYHVDATPGQVLTGFEVIPVGVTQNGEVRADVDHVGEGIQSYSQIGGGSTASLGAQSFFLSGSQSGYDVITTLKLIGNGANSLNKATIYNVRYTEAVPEPATMAALGLGIAALLRRKRK